LFIAIHWFKGEKLLAWRWGKWITTEREAMAFGEERGMNYRDRYYWFPARKTGWGWGVANNWKGVLVQIGIPAVVFVAGWYLLPRREAALFFGIFVVALVVFVALHWIKGEPPYWRW
jgi:hypothetical protein